MDGHQKQRNESARMIEDALFELMKEKAYAQITVTEIVKRVDVSRRTFYRIYKEKDEVLRSFFGKLCREYERTVLALPYYDVAWIARDFFCFWHGYRELLLLFHKRGMEEMLYYEISRVAVEVVGGRMKGAECENAAETECFAYYSAGGFLLLLWRWIHLGMKGEPEEYAKEVSGAIEKFVER